MLDTQSETNTYSFRDIIGTARQRRDVKNATKDIGLSGRRGNELDDIMLNTDRIVSQMSDTHTEWFEQKMEQMKDYFDYDSASTKTKLNESFSHGLDRALIQKYRLYRDAKQDNSALFDDEHLQDIVTGFSFDFYRILRTCQRLEINPGTAIRVAEKAYLFDPRFIARIYTDPAYSDITQTVITHALVHTSNPDDFLRTYQRTVADLSSRDEFKDVGKSVIGKAALNDDPEAHIRAYQRRLADINDGPNNDDLSQKIKNQAALRKDSNAYLKYYRTTFARLRPDTRFELVTDSILEHAIVGYKDPESFLGKHLIAVKRLFHDPRFSEINLSIINEATLRSDPEGYALWYLELFGCIMARSDLRILGSSIINAVIISHSDPIAYLEMRLPLYDQYMSDPKYNILGKHTVLAGVFKTTDTQTHLDLKRTVLDSLQQDTRFSDLPFAVFEKALQRNNSTGFMERVLSRYAELRVDPDTNGLSRTQLLISSCRSDPKAFIEERERRKSSIKTNPKYANISDGLLDRALFYYDEPELYLDDCLREGITTLK